MDKIDEMKMMMVMRKAHFILDVTCTAKLTQGSRKDVYVLLDGYTGHERRAGIDDDNSFCI